MNSCCSERSEMNPARSFGGLSQPWRIQSMAACSLLLGMKSRSFSGVVSRTMLSSCSR